MPFGNSIHFRAIARFPGTPPGDTDLDRQATSA